MKLENSLENIFGVGFKSYKDSCDLNSVYDKFPSIKHRYIVTTGLCGNKTNGGAFTTTHAYETRNRKKKRSLDQLMTVVCKPVHMANI